MKTCKCPFCRTEANFISAKPEELPSYPAGIPTRWPNATEHLIGVGCAYGSGSPARRTVGNT